MVQGSQFNLASVSENSILTILKSIQVSKAAGHFLKDGAKFLAKPLSDLCTLSINSEKFPDLCKVVKLKPLYKKGSLTQPFNYRPIFLLTLISKVIDNIIHNKTSIFLNSKNLLHTNLVFEKSILQIFAFLI